ncbi:hypothetical protein ACFL5O_09350 [Myxococcota bacterium]
MSVHPIVLASTVVDVAAALLLCWAAVTAFHVVQHWDPGQAVREQLVLESRFEVAAVLTRGAVLLYCVATAGFILAITAVLPDIVPGAMCGTGVLEATHGLGLRALLFRLLAIGALGGWRLVDSLDRSHPLSLLAKPSARTLLLALPLVVLAVWETARAFAHLDPAQPVSCCTLLHEQAASGATVGDVSGRWAVALAGSVGLLLIAAGGVLAWGGDVWRRRAGLLAAGLSLVWVGVASLALTRGLASYHYGVLGHSCFWCLFLWEHWAVGFPLFGAIVWTALEGLAAGLAVGIAQRFPMVAATAHSRARRAGWRLIGGVIAYALISGLPAVVYRLRFGVWLHSSP